MDRSCTLCGKEFRDPATLKRHSLKKLPCVATDAVHHTCLHCNRLFTTVSAKCRHIRNSCPVLKKADTTVQKLVEKVEELESIIRQGPVSTQTIQNNTVNINTVNITQWGSPPKLTDSDVEKALSILPLGALELPDIVAVLMELVKRSHIPQDTRNIYINPKRADQALALTAGGWAALPLNEATAVLFDGASDRISAPGSTSIALMRGIMIALPAKYQAERAGAVQMGLRPMEAHLANMAPGGPGPLLLESKPPPAIPDRPPQLPQPTHSEKVKTMLRTFPPRCSPSGALDRDWIVMASREAGVSAQELFAALAAGQDDAVLAPVLAAARIYTEEKMRIRP